MDPTDASVLQLLTMTSDSPAQQSTSSASYISQVPALGSFKGVTVQNAAHLFEVVANNSFNTEDFSVFARAYIGNDIARYSNIVKACSLSSGIDGKQIWEISLALQSIRITVFGTEATFIMILGDLQNGVWKLHDPLLAEIDKLSPMNQAPPPKPKVKIPRPPNAFILYRSHYHSYVKARFPGMHNNDISKVIADQWKHESESQKDEWRARAREMKDAHREQHPDYSYNPRKPGEKKKRMTKSKLAKAEAQRVALQDAQPIIFSVPSIPQPAHVNVAPTSVSPSALHLPLFTNVDDNLKSPNELTAVGDMSAPVIFTEGIDCPISDLLSWDSTFDPFMGLEPLISNDAALRQEQLHEEALMNLLK